MIKHEQSQNSQIFALWQKIVILEETTEGSDAATVFKTKQGYRYLAIGNSITVHERVDYWWGEWGMAASKKNFDYVHRIIKFLEDKENDEIAAMAYNYSAWELQDHDRAETWKLLDNYLFDGIDMITVQLSENCHDTTTFLSDFAALLSHIREKCGRDVQIVVIDDFWDNEKSEMKKAVCEEMGVDFVDLSDIRGQAEYQAGLETTVYGDSGEQYAIKHEGVARHPGDKGMKIIAERVIAAITQ